MSRSVPAALAWFLAATLFPLAPVFAADSAAEHRAASAALLAGPVPPTPEAFLRAHVLAGAAERLAPFEPWGQAAHCDLARRWGDPRLTAACVATLVARAPDHVETRRAVALAARDRHGLILTMGWVLLVLLVVLTWWRARRKSGRGHDLAAIATLVATLFLGGTGGAATAAPSPPPAPAPIVVDDRDPESTVPSPAQRDANPLEFGYHLQELIARAEAATQRQDHLAAARYYRALARAVPDRSTAFGKLCASLEAAGDRPGARAACLTATGLPGVTVNDFTRFVRLTLAGTTPLTAAEIAEARSATQHLVTQPGATVVAHQLACELAVRTHDVPALQRCTTALAEAAPDDARTLSFQWALAVEQKDHARAQSLIAQAERAGVAPPGIARMKQGTETLLGAGGWRWLLDWRLVAMAVLLLAGVATLFRSRRRPATRG